MGILDVWEEPHDRYVLKTIYTDSLNRTCTRYLVSPGSYSKDYARAKAFRSTLQTSIYLDSVADLHVAGFVENIQTQHNLTDSWKVSIVLVKLTGAGYIFAVNDVRELKMYEYNDSAATVTLDSAAVPSREGYERVVNDIYAAVKDGAITIGELKEVVNRLEITTVEDSLS